MTASPRTRGGVVGKEPARAASASAPPPCLPLSFLPAQTYVDMLLNHWPTSPATPTIDPACDPAKPTYNEKQCRLNTWAAYVQLWKSGMTKAIGVANYNASHLQEIIDAQMPLPSVNQIPFHIYNAASQADTLAFCRAHNITVLSYSPLGIPDYAR